MSGHLICVKPRSKYMRCNNSILPDIAFSDTVIIIRKESKLREAEELAEGYRAYGRKGKGSNPGGLAAFALLTIG